MYELFMEFLFTVSWITMFSM